PVDTVVTGLSEYGKAAISTSVELRDAAAELKTIGDQLPKLTSLVEQAGAQVSSVSRPLEDATGALNSACGDLATLVVSVAGFSATLKEVAVQTTSLDGGITRILAELTAFSTQVENSTATIGRGLASVESTVMS